MGLRSKGFCGAILGWCLHDPVAAHGCIVRVCILQLLGSGSMEIVGNRPGLSRTSRSHVGALFTYLSTLGMRNPLHYISLSL
ncbi:hypothetical protein M758_UG145300 [Ceratodon purpureus]|nr:hypothetical protein M758_UG145300 [Ceratodon purpureus]